MIRVLRFTRLTFSDSWLLIRTGLLVTVVRLLLWVRPWPAALHVPRQQPLSFLLFRRSRDFSAERAAWAVRTSSALIPGATCLTQALALHWLLTRAGRPSCIQIGVAKGAHRGLEGHAWVEHEGHTLLTPSSEALRYVRFVTLEGASLKPASPLGPCAQ